MSNFAPSWRAPTKVVWKFKGPWWTAYARRTHTTYNWAYLGGYRIMNGSCAYNDGNWSLIDVDVYDVRTPPNHTVNVVSGPRRPGSL